MEGVRPVLAEIQALVVPSSLGNPRRVSNGFDYSRSMLLLAVLEKRGGLMVGNCDAYLNVIGGLYLEEPAADLGEPGQSKCVNFVPVRPSEQSGHRLPDVGHTNEL